MLAPALMESGWWCLGWVAWALTRFGPVALHRWPKRQDSTGDRANPLNEELFVFSQHIIMEFQLHPMLLQPHMCARSRPYYALSMKFYFYTCVLALVHTTLSQ